MFKGMAAMAQGERLKPFEFDPGTLKDDHVEIAVEYCGVCHSDLSLLNNDWGNTQYPAVAGHEVVGKVVALGDHVKTLSIGQRVGLGWYSGSCLVCPSCMGGDHNLCVTPGALECTAIGRYGGFANRVRCQSTWATPLPEGLDFKKVGPLFCGGITVFNPIIQFGVRPTDRVGVIGIGGLGHLALAFLNKWGCEVTAFTSSESKRAEALQLGAHKVVNSRDSDQIKKIRGSLNFIISTVNVSLDWHVYVEALAPKGRLHTVGAVPEPISVSAFSLLFGQKSISGSPAGSPTTAQMMIDFCARHNIAPVTEHFKLTEINEALAHLSAGKARYRIVLENDLG